MYLDSFTTAKDGWIAYKNFVWLEIFTAKCTNFQKFSALDS